MQFQTMWVGVVRCFSLFYVYCLQSLFPMSVQSIDVVSGHAAGIRLTVNEDDEQRREERGDKHREAFVLRVDPSVPVHRPCVKTLSGSSL